jgi:hypothetical protein
MALNINTIFTKNNRINNVDMHGFSEVNWIRKQFMPLSMRLPGGEWWHFPLEPLISVSGKNAVVKRNVAKSEYCGTIKERWAEDDFQINIQGAFNGPDLYTYPTQEVKYLEQIITQRRPVEVLCELFQMLNIHQIVIESYSFPFSKGENVQNFTIDASSDDLYKLFIDVKNV